MLLHKLLLPLFLSWSLLSSLATGFATPSFVGSQRRQEQQRIVLYADTTAASETSPNAAPVLNGKRVLPYKIIKSGLKGHKVAGAYALLNSEYKRGYAGWEQCEHIGISMDLDTTLEELMVVHGSDKIAHTRVMTFVVPSRGAMEEIAGEWRFQAVNVGGKINFDPVMAAMEFPAEDDDDDDDDEDDMDEEDFEFMQMQAEAMAMGRATAAAVPVEEEPSVVSPFQSDTTAVVAEGGGESSSLAFTKENVDSVLEEVRPYLISDGGNVSVERIDAETGNVYLKLEGACGSCPSSTVTMKMGIERVLKENFPDTLGEVLQVEDEDDKPKELTYQVVEGEVNRIKGAIVAMGGMVEIVTVDPNGLVELKFKGANKVRQGLELAIMDIDFVNEVRFLMDDDDE